MIDVERKSLIPFYMRLILLRRIPIVKRFKLLWSLVERPGAKEVETFLSEKTVFYTSPASHAYHGAHEHGLLEHGWKVYYFFMQLNETFQLGISEETIIICAFFHDLCKVGLYIKTREGYVYDKEKVKKGHAKYSLERIDKFEQKFSFRLTLLEKEIIKYHMSHYANFAYSKKNDSYFQIPNSEYTPLELHIARCKHPAVKFFSFADEMASRSEEIQDKKVEQRQKKIELREEKNEGVPIEQADYPFCDYAAIKEYIEVNMYIETGISIKEIYDYFGHHKKKEIDLSIKMMEQLDKIYQTKDGFVALS